MQKTINYYKGKHHGKHGKHAIKYDKLKIEFFVKQGRTGAPESMLSNYVDFDNKNKICPLFNE